MPALTIAALVTASMTHAQVSAPVQSVTAPCLPQPQPSATAPAAPAPARGGAPQVPVVRQVSIQAIPDVVAAGSMWAQVWQTGGNNADGVLATADGSLLIAQEDNNAIVRIAPDDSVSVFMSGTGGAGSLSMDRQGRLYAVQRMLDPRATPTSSAPASAAIAMLSPERRLIANTFAGGALLTGRPNDLAVDRNGGAYFTLGSCVYHASPAAGITSVADHMRTNGIVLSPDEKTLYVTNGPTVSAFDVRPEGTLANRRDFASLEAGGNGDGMTIDEMGRLYVTSAPGVQVFNPRGTYVGLIPTPRAVISLSFAGAGKQWLYIVGVGASGPDGQSISEGPQRTGRTIYKLPMIAAGYKPRAK